MVLALLIAWTIPGTGVFRLPAGVTEIASELKLPDGAHDLTITGDHTTLHAAASFQGRAIFSCRGCRRIHFTNFSIDGNRAALEKPLPFAPSDKTFASVFPNPGILIEDTDGISIDHVAFANVTNFSVLIGQSKNVAIDHVSVKDSGSRNAKGRNNTSGGILLEEGTETFAVTDSTFRNIPGNGVWTHSRYMAPRNRWGKILRNQFFEIARDAIQVGHAANVRVEDNDGAHIGYPAELVDIEDQAYPAALDTAGDVDGTTYTRNRFTEVDGKCIDLDGFHDGDVTGNSCINRPDAALYPFGNVGILFNDSHPHTRSKDIRLTGNLLDGVKFTGIYTFGTGHIIAHNRLLNVNLAHCNEEAAKYGCYYPKDEPDALQSGIYLGRGFLWSEPARGIVVEDNEISGFGMTTRCVGYAAGVQPGSNTVRNNRCE